MRNPGFLFAAALMVLLSAPTMAQTAITYQGQLQDSNGPVTGTVDMEFVLYDDEAGTTPLGTDGPYSVDVADGLFRVELDFGDVYASPPDYLEILVDDTPLNELQKLTPAPSAISVPWSGVTGAPGFWRLGGNAGTAPGTDYLGTTDETAFALRVDDREALRIIPSTDPNLSVSTPNLIGGHPVNDVDESTDNDPPIVGAVVGGGGSPGFANRVGEDFATIGGGSRNTASGFIATVGGGDENTASGRTATVGGGVNNIASDRSATVSGGSDNTASESYSTVSGGYSNTASNSFATVPGGRFNCAGGSYSFAAGRTAIVRPPSDPDDMSSCAGLPSYPGNTTGDEGTFVWAGSSSIDFISTGPNQFLVRASGGIGLNTNAPDAPLHLAGENNWDLSNTEGDFKIGNDTYRFKLGVSLGGAGAGNVRLRAQGGTHNLILGSNESDVVKVNDTAGLDPMTDNNFSLGSSGARWSAVWAADGTINTSDARLKRDVVPLDGALDDVLALRPVTYRWKAQPKRGKRLGLLAQEVHQILPEIVVEPEDEKGALGIRYSELIPVLIAAVQEQDQTASARFDQLESENAELHRQIASQQQQVQAMAERNRALQSRLASLEDELGERVALLEALLVEQETLADAD